MPVSGFQYNTRPYSSFRTTRGGVCGLQQQQTTANFQSITNAHNCSKTSLNGNNNTVNNNNNINNYPLGHNLQTSASSSAIGVRSTNGLSSNNNNSNSNGISTSFQRQQPFRSSFYGTRYNHKTVENIAPLNCKSANNGSSLTGTVSNNVTVKPLTPKLVRRIETTCTHHTKAKAPAPPVTNGSNCSTPPTAHKQYLRARNQQQPPPPTPPLRKSTNFDRFHQANLSIRQKTTNSHKCSNSVSSFISNDSQESILPKYQQTTAGATQKRAYTNTVSN